MLGTGGLYKDNALSAFAGGIQVLQLYQGEDCREGEFGKEVERN
jgi:hypothetical protein